MSKIKRKTMRKYRRVLALYVHFATDGQWDYSDEAAEKMFRCESLGEYALQTLINERNGYAIGKHWKDLTVQMWSEDIQKGPTFLTKSELLSDPATCWDMLPTIKSLPDWKSGGMERFLRSWAEMEIRHTRFV
jgi:hypothetical protein